MTNLEIEYKTLLTKDEYNRLLSQMSHVAPVTQTNYYIDTEGFDLKLIRCHCAFVPLQIVPN